MGSALRFRQSNVPKQAGEIARLKVVQGPDYGSVFVVMGARATIGRGDENDIVLADLKASRSHAALIGGPDGWGIKDIGSANGIIVNGQSVREARLRIKDILKIGETTLEFMASEAGTMMLVAPPRDIQQIQAEQRAYEEQRKRIRGTNAPPPGISGQIPRAQTRDGSSSGVNGRFVLYGGALLVFAVMYYLESSQAPVGAKKGGKKDARDLASYLPAVDEPSVNRTAEMFFRSGFREFRERNYLRARVQFETVLQIVPSHRLSLLYLEKANKAIKDEVTDHLIRGKKSLDAGKIKEAKAHYEAVKRLLHRDQSSDDFKTAKEALEELKGAGKGVQ